MPSRVRAGSVVRKHLGDAGTAARPEGAAVARLTLAAAGRVSAGEAWERYAQGPGGPGGRRRSGRSPAPRPGSARG